MKVIVFDFEVFKYDTLLGAKIIGQEGYFQTWNYAKMKEFYEMHQNDVWVGHNNTDYDNHILEAVIKNRSTYETSCKIIKERRRLYLNLKLYYYDLMQWHMGSLKVMEAAFGKNISESEVDFNVDRPLTEKEKLETESYNRDDLDQTELDLMCTKSEFQLRIDLIKEFNLPLAAFSYTEAQIAAKALGAKRDDSLINKPVHSILYPQMRVKNQEMLDFYLNEKFRDGDKPKIVLCGLEHQFGSGGVHAAAKKCHAKFALYFDVSGYYNLIMIKYNLLSRAIPEEGKQLYEYMYGEQLRLKKIDPRKRAVYKKILLAVFGAQMHLGSDFYDPWNGALVPVVGQMFLVDLLEKLEGKVELMQSNTDGIIAVPLVEENEVIDIINEWQTRTGLTLKIDKIYDIFQRDVNNYMYRDDKGVIHTKGEAVGYYEGWENPLENNSYNSKVPLIIQYCIVDYLMNGIKPERTIVTYSKNLRMFQWICKLQTYDYFTFEKGGEVIRMQKVNRCFASKESGMLYKNKEGKHDKYSNLADKVFVWNDSLDKLDNKRIDYIYYARRAWERIYEFIDREPKN